MKNTVDAYIRRIPERLNSIREAQGITVKELSIDTGICTHTLYSLEAGRCIPTLETILKLSMYFGVSIEWFMKK